MIKIKQFFSWIKKQFSVKCPICKGELKRYETETGLKSHQCVDCNKNWIM